MAVATCHVTLFGCRTGGDLGHFSADLPGSWQNWPKTVLPRSLGCSKQLRTTQCLDRYMSWWFIFDYLLSCTIQKFLNNHKFCDAFCDFFATRCETTIFISILPTTEHPVKWYSIPLTSYYEDPGMWILQHASIGWMTADSYALARPSFQILKKDGNMRLKIKTRTTPSNFHLSGNYMIFLMVQGTTKL